MIKGITVILYEKTQKHDPENPGELLFDPFGKPVTEETPTEVENVLVGEPGSDELINELNLYGKRLRYVLAIPKGDTHNWENAHIEFWGESFRSYGAVMRGIEENIPLNWNRKVKVESYG